MKNKLLKTVLTTTTVASVMAPIATLASCNKATNPDTPVDPITPEQEQLFDITDSKLNGFKSGVTDQQIKDYCKDGILRLPAVKTIAADAFNVQLKAVPFGGEIKISAETTSIGAKAFFGYSATSVTWEGSSFENTVGIGESAFAFCSSLASFKMPAGLFNGGTIGANAFIGCSKLDTLDCSALTVDKYASANFSNWAFGCLDGMGSKDGTAIVKTAMAADQAAADQKAFGSKVWSRMAYAGLNPRFAVADNTGTSYTQQYKYVPTEYFVLDGTTLKGAKLAWTDDFNYAVLPSGVASIDTTTNLFTTKTKIVNWDLSAATGLTTIPDNCFASVDTPASKTITLGSGVTTIGASAFSGFSGTISLTSSNITSIGLNAFINSGISSWTFASNVQVGSNAFNNCSKLSSLDFSAYSTTPSATWGTNVFSSATGTTGTNTLTLKTLQSTSTDTKVEQVKLNSDMYTFLKGKGLSFTDTSVKWTISPTLSISYDQLFDISNNTLNGWAKSGDTPTALTKEQAGFALKALNKTELTLPSGVTSIAANAFFDGTNSTIPDCITSINLTNSGVTSIGANAFKSLPSTVKSFTLPTAIVTIGANAFENYPLASIDLANKTSLTTIGTSAFANSSLTAVTLTNDSSLKAINSLAFAGSTNLANVTFPTDNKWRQPNGIELLTLTSTTGNADQLKDGTTTTSWGYTGLEKVLAFSNTEWTDITAAINKFETSTETVDDMKRLCCSFSDISYTSGSTVAQQLVNFVGQTHTIKINNLDNAVRIIGVDHDTLQTATTSGITKAAFTFQLDNILCWSDKAPMVCEWNSTNNFNYLNSTLRNHLNSTSAVTWYKNGGSVISGATQSCLSMLPTDVSSAIKTTRHYAATVTGGTEWQEWYTGTVTNDNEYWDKVFVPNYFNLTSTRTQTYCFETPANSPVYQYYSDSSTESSRRVRKHLGGSAYYYWVASPRPNDNSSDHHYHGWFVNTDGSIGIDNAQNKVEGLCIAFAI